VRGGRTSIGLDLLDLVFRLERSFGVRIIRTVAGSLRLYDSAFDPPAVVKKRSRTHASQDPWGDHDDGPSSGGISVLSGSPVTTWSTLPLTTRSQTEYDLRLSPDSPVIVGRSDGWSPEYLDPAYRPTRIVPGTGQAVLHSGGHGSHSKSLPGFALTGHFGMQSLGVFHGAFVDDATHAPRPRPGRTAFFDNSG
jgi:hypothetical protein